MWFLLCERLNDLIEVEYFPTLIVLFSHVSAFFLSSLQTPAQSACLSGKESMALLIENCAQVIDYGVWRLKSLLLYSSPLSLTFASIANSLSLSSLYHFSIFD